MDKGEGEKCGKVGESFWKEYDPKLLRNEGLKIQQDYADLAIIAEWIKIAGEIVENQCIIKERNERIQDKQTKKAMLSAEISQLTSAIIETRERTKELQEDCVVLENILTEVNKSFTCIAA